MPRSPLPLLLALLAAAALVAGEDLYKLLGLSRRPAPKASEIKAAYRARARETHPDKQRDKDPEVAAAEFRKIAEAYEVLSDPHSRRIYDQTGQRSSRPQQQQQQQQDGPFTFHFNFGNFGGQQFHGRRSHPHLFNPHLRRQILAAHSRIIRIRSLEHLLSVAGAGTDADADADADADPDSPSPDVLLDRYVLLAFINAGDEDCSHKLLNELLFPWPFAGYSSEGGKDGSSSDSVGDAYWDDILVIGKVKLNGRPDSAASRLAARFGIDAQLDAQSCPTILLLNRGERIERRDPADPTPAPGRFQPQVFVSAVAFSAFIWPQLKVTVSFINLSLWPVDMWWLDGTLGKKIAVLQIGESYTSSTFLSHVFIFRPTKVEGYGLTNESSLLWYTAKVDDDGKQVPILPRCHEIHGDCVRWRSEGFCDTTGVPSVYVLQNPGFAPWVQQNCIVSCGKGCASDRLQEQQEQQQQQQRGGRGGHLPAHTYHTHDEL